MATKEESVTDHIIIIYTYIHDSVVHVFFLVGVFLLSLFTHFEVEQGIVH